METVIKYGHKPIWIKVLLVFLAFLIIALVNGLFLFFTEIGLGLSVLLLISLVFTFILFWWFGSVRYEFDNNGISVILPWNKTYIFDKKDIASIDKIDSINISKIGYNTNITLKEIYILTSNESVCVISLKDGKKVYISPRNFSGISLDYYCKSND